MVWSHGLNTRFLNMNRPSLPRITRCSSGGPRESAHSRAELGLRHRLETPIQIPIAIPSKTRLDGLCGPIHPHPKAHPSPSKMRLDGQSGGLDDGRPRGRYGRNPGGHGHPGLSRLTRFHAPPAAATNTDCASRCRASFSLTVRGPASAHEPHRKPHSCPSWLYARRCPAGPWRVAAPTVPRVPREATASRGVVRQRPPLGRPTTSALVIGGGRPASRDSLR